MSRNETQITWPTGANTKSVALSTEELSEAIVLDQTAVSASITLKVSNDGTAADGDTVTFWYIGTAGDPDGAATIEYPNSDDTHAQRLTTLDTFAGISGVAVKTVYFPHNPYRSKIRAVNNSGTNSITVSATIEEDRR